MASSASRAAATAAGRLSHSTTVVMGAKSGHHIFRVKGYSQAKELPNGQYMNLGAFDVGGHSWSVHYYPNGIDCAEAVGCVSLFVCRDGKLGGSGMPARYSFSLLGQDGEPVASGTGIRPTRGFNMERYGYRCFMTRDEFERSGCLKVDSFAIRCDVFVAAREHQDAAGVLDDPTTTTPVVVPPKSDLQKDLAELLWSKQGADVTIEVGGETFHAHKWLLAARSSPEFREKFFGPTTQKKTSAATHIHIQIDDMEPEVFKSLLHFMYTDTLPKIDDEEALSRMASCLLAAADRYKLEKLMAMCEEILCERVDMSTVEASLALCEQHNCPALNAACMEFLAAPENLKAIVAENGLLQRPNKSCHTVLMEIFMKKLVERETAEAHSKVIGS
ncbi:unnamed protein product [Urochloa decumbens]|uniref:BTB domain-containing protein n=1 Tax=Urochloa decumbens TaxID=240449 RepID=A0ABC9E0J0_9POAL